MCTVTFIPLKTGYLLTSNRDERITRPVATFPALYKMNTGSILFPKDPQAGGTWFAIHENGSVAVLLNGGLIKHKQLYHYKRSRGLVLLDILDNSNPTDQIQSMPLDGIEPFTAILWVSNTLHEFVWTGIEKIMRKLLAGTPYVWSSATLYPGKVAEARKRWLMEWLTGNPEPTQQDVINFHLSGGDGDPENALLMSRDEGYRTVSITSAAISSHKITVDYLDCTSGISTTSTILYQHEILQYK